MAGVCQVPPVLLCQFDAHLLALCMPCCARLRSKPSVAVWQRRDCPQDVHASTRGLSLPCPCQHKGTMPRISLLAQLEMHCREMALGRKILELPGWLGSEQPRRGRKRTICTYWGFLFNKTFSFHLLPVSLRSRGSGAAQPSTRRHRGTLGMQHQAHFGARCDAFYPKPLETLCPWA